MIRISVDEDSVGVEIRDEGSGISSEVLAGFRSGTRLLGVGLAGMRERIRDMGGSFEIDSSEKGTAIQVALSLPASAKSGTV